MRNAFVWVIIILLLVTLFNLFQGGTTASSRVAYSEFLTSVEEADVTEVSIHVPESILR